MQPFKITYKILDYTLDPPPVMLFDKEEHVAINMRTALYGILPKEYVFDIRVGDYVYSVEKERIHTIQYQVSSVLREMLGFKETYIPSKERLENMGLPILDKNELYSSIHLYYVYVSDSPIWDFFFTKDSDVVKVFPRFTQGVRGGSDFVPLLPPWTVDQSQPINQPPVLCSKKQIVTELYKLYLNMVQDAKKMYPEEFKDEEYMEEAYEEWKEEMKQYKAAIEQL